MDVVSQPGRARCFLHRDGKIADAVAVASGMHSDRLRTGIREIGVGRGRSATGLSLTHHVQPWVLLHAIIDAVEVMGEPAVHHVDRRRTTMTTLMEVDRRGRVLFAQRFEDPDAVFRHDVPVIQSVGEEHRRPDVLDLGQQVTIRPEIVIVAVRTITPCGKEPVANGAIAAVAKRRVTAVDEIVQVVDVFAEPATRMTYQTVGPVVVIVRRVGRIGDDCLEPLHSGHGGGEWQGPFV